MKRCFCSKRMKLIYWVRCLKTRAKYWFQTKTLYNQFVDYVSKHKKEPCDTKKTKDIKIIFKCDLQYTPEGFSNPNFVEDMIIM